MNTDVVIQGDALEVLPQLPAGHFHCCAADSALAPNTYTKADKPADAPLFGEKP